MTIKELHWAFKIKADKIDSADKRNFLPNEIDYFINQAVLLIFNTLSPVNNKNQIITDILKPLVKVAIITDSDFTLTNDYTEVTLPENYAKFLRARIKETECSSKYQTTVTSLDDLNRSLSNEFTKPSSKWKRAILVFRDAKLSFYTESTLEEVELEYFKIPDSVCIGTYNDINGDPTSVVELEYPTWTHELVTDLSALIAHGTLENDRAYQLIMNTIKIYYDSYNAS